MAPCLTVLCGLCPSLLTKSDFPLLPSSIFTKSTVLVPAAGASPRGPHSERGPCAQGLISHLTSPQCSSLVGKHPRPESRAHQSPESLGPGRVDRVLERQVSPGAGPLARVTTLGTMGIGPGLACVPVQGDHLPVALSWLLFRASRLPSGPPCTQT